MKYVKDNRTETEKMLDIIHRNHDDIRMNRNMDRQLKELNQKEKKSNKLIYVLLGIAFVSVCIFMFNYSQKQVNSCVAAGHDENWCVKNG